jgi:hypothetical protein
MCLILDKNIAHEIAQNNEDAQPIADWLEARKGILATGGDNLIELLDTRIGRLIRECLRDGRARNFSDRNSMRARSALLGMMACDLMIIMF